MTAKGIIPPYIFEELLKRGKATQQKIALNSLLNSFHLRGYREAMSMLFVAAPAGGKCIRIFNVKNGDKNDLPGEWIKSPQKSTDIAIKEAFAGLDATYNFYKEVYNRFSIDDRGLCIEASIHFGNKYDNAFWDGRQMVFGDGDGDIFNRFTISLDVIGHELTHGVNDYEANLKYQAQSGALSESLSDVMGILVKQWTLNQTVDQADWIIGVGLFTKKIRAKGIRSMSEPGTAYDDPLLGKDPQPAHMKDFRKLPLSEEGDYGGVHINSGIPNKAFYLAASQIGGFAWEKTGKIWYMALRDVLRFDSDFNGAAEATIMVAGKLFGNESTEQKAVRDGWREVGVL